MRTPKHKNASLSRLLPRAKATKWLFLGDSITLGARHTHGCRDYTQLFTERVRYELRRHQDLVLNAAVDGSTAGGCLANLDHILASFKPDVALLMIGMNDAATDREGSSREFKITLRAIIARLRNAGAHVVLQTPNPIVPELAAPYRRKFGGIIRAIRETAKTEGVSLVDHNKHWEDLFKSSGRSLVISYMCDGVHPNALGHGLLAKYLINFIKIPKQSTVLTY